VEVPNVLVGDVWLCGGQSNMERTLGLHNSQKPIVNWEQEAATGDLPGLRTFTVPHRFSKTPEFKAEGNWTIATPQDVLKFSAVAFFFGRDLYQRLGIPVGLIHSSWGGTPVEAWMRRDLISGLPGGDAVFEKLEKAIADYPAKLAAFREQEPQLMAEWEKAVQKANQEGTKPPGKPQPPSDPALDKNQATGLFNAMIQPLIPYAIRGVIWYQGESNRGNPQDYAVRFPAMIRDWRQLWGGDEFPFLFVQVAPFNAMPPEIREAQRQSWLTTPKTAMVVTVDCGDAEDIHPADKRPVGERLALAARAIAYGEAVEYSGPAFESFKVQGGKALVAFKHVGKGLEAKGGPLRGFEIAGADGKFLAAEAVIRDTAVEVSHPSVAEPVAVRYGWANVPDGNLFNRDGLPASPFQSK
jgi:sialate O-acetylesterase